MIRLVLLAIFVALAATRLWIAYEGWQRRHDGLVMDLGDFDDPQAVQPLESREYVEAELRDVDRAFALEGLLLGSAMAGACYAAVRIHRQRPTKARAVVPIVVTIVVVVAAFTAFVTLAAMAIHG